MNTVEIITLVTNIFIMVGGGVLAYYGRGRKVGVILDTILEKSSRIEDMENRIKRLERKGKYNNVS